MAMKLSFYEYQISENYAYFSYFFFINNSTDYLKFDIHRNLKVSFKGGMKSWTFKGRKRRV